MELLVRNLMLLAAPDSRSWLDNVPVPPAGRRHLPHPGGDKLHVVGKLTLILLPPALESG
jgi:hypothetical protein